MARGNRANREVRQGRRERRREKREGREFDQKFEGVRQASVVTVHAKNAAQAEFLDVLGTAKIAVGMGSAGTGKAQPLYSKVLTPDGWVTMGSLTVGDSVVGSSGATTVLGIYPQGSKEVYRLTLADGGVVEACIDHLWTIDSNKNPVKSGKKLKQKNRRTMTTKELIGLLEGGGGGNISVPRLENVCFSDTGRLPVDPYLLGFLLGDGSMTTATPSFSTSDVETVVEVSRILGEGFSVTQKSEYDYNITDSLANWQNPNRLTTKLKELGVHGKTSVNKFIPDVYLFAGIDDRYAMLQGILDSDGTVDKRTGAVSFCTTSPLLAEGVRTIVLSLGGKASITQTEKSFVYKGEKKKGLTAYIVSINVEDKSRLFRLDRKKSKVSNTDVSQLARNIIKAEYVGMVDCQCIMVDSEDHLYVTDDFILTHNTFMAATHAANQYLRNPKMKIYISRPYVPMGKSVGLLPGEVEDKIAPFLAPITSVLKAQLGPKFEADFGRNIHIQLIEAIRGLDLRDAILIVDEAQNLNIDEVKSIVTRLGDNSQIILIGDSAQCDLDYDESGLPWLVDVVDRHGVDGVDFVEFFPEHIVRSGIARRFVEIFEKEAKNGNA